MACSTPYKANTSHKIMPYRHPNPPRSVEEMARGIVYIYIYIYPCVCVHQPWNALNNIKQREFGASPKTWFSVTMTLFREVPEELHVEGLKSSNLPLGPWDHGTMINLPMGPWVSNVLFWATVPSTPRNQCHENVHKTIFWITHMLMVYNTH